MTQFIPKRAIFEQSAMDYPLGRHIYDRLTSLSVPISFAASHNRITSIPGKTAGQAYREAKQTLVVGVRKSTKFATCKPSAHYQLPLNTSCPGMCEYCYLATTLGKKPYLRVYVNVDDILSSAGTYICQHAPAVTIFEGAATSDPIPTEYLTGLLKATIEFFGQEALGRFRFVTKFTDIASLLDARHNGHTRFRFSLNAVDIIRQYEHHTPALDERIDAAVLAALAGYPLGFIIAPIFYFPGWQLQYGQLVEALADKLGKLPVKVQRNLTFELISHRFTKRAKANILDVFPNTVLPLDEDERKFKFGQFGYGKYIYDQAAMGQLKDFIQQKLHAYFPQAAIDYFV